MPEQEKGPENIRSKRKRRERRKRDRSREESGFTLIETIIAASIFLILIAAFSSLALFVHRDSQNQVSLAEGRQQARVAASLFANDVQKAGLDPTGRAFHTSQKRKAKHLPLFDPLSARCTKGAFPAKAILQASETVFHFMGDLNRSGTFYKTEENGKSQADFGEEVRYEWVGEDGKDSCGVKRAPYTLYRHSGSGMQEVASSIQEFTLIYYDADYHKLSSGLLNESELARIRKIVLTLRSAGENGIHQGREVALEIFLRNMG